VKIVSTNQYKLKTEKFLQTRWIKMKPQKFKILFWVCVLTLIFPSFTESQQYSISDMVVVNGGAGYLSHGTKSTTLTVGQAFVGEMSSAYYSITFGFWGFYLKEPDAPIVSASDGDYANQVLITWELDVLSPPAIDAESVLAYKLLRNGMELATLPANKTYYPDNNTFAGTFYTYTYEVYASNNFGEGEKGSDIGFVNPNGTITGHIETPNSVAVPGVEVSISPTLGQALSFDGSDDYVAIPSSTSLDIGTNKVTVEAWVKLDILPANLINNYAGIYDSYEASYIFYEDKENNELRFKVTDSDGTAEAPGIPGAMLETGTWHHVAGVYDGDGGTAKIYLDGQLVETHTNTNLAGNVKSGQAATIGSKGGSSSFFQGKIDEVRIWNVARTQEEIQIDINRTLGAGEAGLSAYWKFDEGTGDRVFDMTDNDNDGVIYGAQWIDDIAPVQTSAFTDIGGNYIIKGIYYGTSTPFTVTPSKDLHSFQPQSRVATLNTSNTSIDNVDFTDNSLISVSGHIRFDNTDCNVGGVEIRLNSTSENPPSFTDAEGYFVLEFEPEASATLLPSFNNHPFTPSSFEFKNISTPISSIIFEDMQTYLLEGVVAGGTCKFPIGQSTVTITSTNSCFDTTVTTVNDGRFKVMGLPPLEYRVSVDHPDPSIDETLQDVIISLEDTSQTVDFIYQAPLEVEITGFPVNTCSLTVLEQFESYEITINVFERYSDNICPVDSGVISIFDYVSGIGEITIPFFEGIGTYTFEAGMPNILSGGDHPFQKQIQVVATDINGRSASTDYWVYVEGERPREQTFTTVSPDIPLFILRDPPGDGSFSFLSQDSSICTNVSFSRENTGGKTNWIKGQLGSGLESNAFSGAFGFYATLGHTGTIEEGEIRADEREVCFTVSETFYTSGEDVVGPGGDVFVGGAFNLLYALTDVIYYDTDNCTVVRDTSLGMVPDRFKTTFIYTDRYIRETLLPNLELVAANTANPDSAMLYLDAIEVWQQTLAMNDSLKNIAEFRENISFSGGVSYDYSIETSLDTSWSIEFNTYIDNETAWSANIVLGDFNAIRGGGQYRWRVNEGNSIDTTITTTNVVGFTLTDDDVGDFFSVNIKNDPVYGTPVFETVSGASSCPWEKNTVAREGVQLLMNNYEAINIPPDEPAVFTLYLGNISETDETFLYEFGMLNETNPYGAVIRVDGAQLTSPIEVFIEAGTVVEKTMTVEQGPIEYDYEGLTLRLTSQCEAEIADQLGEDPKIADYAIFSVHFLTPCTEVLISNPGDDWLINQANNDTLWITITGYDTTHPNFQGIDLEYRSITGGSFSRNVNGESGFFSYSNNKTSNIIFPGESNNLQVPNKTTNSQSLQMKRSGLGQARKGLKEMTGLPRSIPVSQDFTGNDRMPVDSGTNREDWISAYSIEKDSLTSSYVIVPWDVQYLDDGNYEIRAVASCSGDIIYADDPVSGIIERSSPRVFGAPQPSDGVLNPNDEISITFEETINCNLINPDSLLVESVITGQEIDNEVSCSDNMLIITLNIANRFIENNTLRVRLNDIEDLYGNAIEEAVIWEFFVDLNPVHWNEPLVEEVVFIGEGDVLTMELRNNGTRPEEFSITNIPEWIEVIPEEGVLNPGGILPVTLTISNELNLGLYEQTLFARTQGGDEPLTVRIHSQCLYPVWDFNPAHYRYNMSVTATVSITGDISTDIADRVGAFVNGESRGIAPLEYVEALDQYEAFLMVYSDEIEGETINFRVWDASDCEEYWRIDTSFNFIANDVIGSIENPVLLNANGAIAQQVDLVQNWTWFSIHLSEDEMNINSILAGMTPTSGDRIIGQTQYESFSEFSGRWEPAILVFEPEKMYQADMIKADKFTLIGFEEDPANIPIKIFPDWNWIGYPVRFNLPIDDALTSFDAEDGTVIKSQLEYAEYVAQLGLWIGSLERLKPGQGYMFKSTSSDTLTLIYPSEAPGSFAPPLLAKSASATSNEVDLPESPWTINPHEFRYNMTITALLESDTVGINNPADVVAAFIGGKCRGVSRPVYVPALDAYRVFMTVYSDGLGDESIEFKIYDADKDIVYRSEDILPFQSNDVVGSVLSPLLLKKGPLSTGDKGYIPKVFSLSQNFPNPFNPITRIGFGIPKDSDVNVKVYNILGQEVKTLLSGRQLSGYRYVLWNGTNNLGQNVTSGMYIVVMEAHSIEGAESFRKKRKMILLK